MDVDLLRPGSVPIALDTVLWFEFLLHKDLLLQHLQKPSPDPSPTQLIAKFSDAVSHTLRNRPDVENVDMIVIEAMHDSVKHPVKNIALKISALKVAAFIKWDISQIRVLTFKTQITILQDLLYFVNDSAMAEIPDIQTEDDLAAISSQYLFALLIYHRWLLHMTMHRINSNWQMRFGNCEISPPEENVMCSPENVGKTISFLTLALSWNKVPGMLTFDCFTLPTEKTGPEFDWSLAEPLSREELVAQVAYELGTFYFYKEDYVLAKEQFSLCLENYKAIEKNRGFATLNRDVLSVYVRACSGPSEGLKGSLFEQFNLSIVNHYKGITTILQQDNVYKEVPLQHRLNLELDIQGALSSATFTVARDLLYKIRALNVVRCVLDKKPAYQYSPTSFKTPETLLWAFEITWKQFSEEDKLRLKDHLMGLIIKDEYPNFLAAVQSNATLSKIFQPSELQYLANCETKIEIPASLNRTDWVFYDFSQKRKPKMELKQLEHELIATYDPKEIQNLLMKISKNHVSASSSAWNVNPQWDIPIPLQSVLKSLPRGPLQDYGLIMLAKAREQMLNKHWNSSLEMLLVLDKELDSSNGNIAKLSRLISWEILLVQITQLLDEWPKSSIDKSTLANACEVCLQSNESVLPRTEVIEQCVLCLLNLGRWEFLIGYDKRWASFDITSALALACHELVKHKGAKKFTKNLWDIVLPIFASPPSQSKRGRGGGGGDPSNSVYQDSHAANLKSDILSIFSKLRDSTVLSIVISMLAKIHNVLKDESGLELQAEYALLWPAVISNANSFSTKAACEILCQLVTQALQYYPTNITWLRLMGDVSFANAHYNFAMKYYLKSQLILHDYFNIPVRPDDHVYRRMIKCCMALNCNTQAAVLCQFLEEPDYTQAFRILSEQKPCNDAVDAYYHCIWDSTILEYLIHMHHKRGEYQRRKCAMQVMGLLELNSNNNDEIQREASNLRKSTFLRALCKQYVF